MMTTTRVRKGITQASWNRQHANWFAAHFLFLASLLGYLSQSWWGFLAAVIGITLLLQFSVGRVVILLLMTFPWVVAAAIIGYLVGSASAACVFALIGGGIAHMMLSTGWQYYDDLV
jgi:hypothetical protein